MLGCVRVLGVRMGEVGLVDDVVVAQPADDVGHELVLALAEIQQFRLKYSVADIVSSGNSAPASSRCSSMRWSHDGSHPQPASM